MESSILRFFALASIFLAAWLSTPPVWAQKKTTKQGAAAGQKAQDKKSSQNAEEEKALLKATQRIQAAHLKELETVAGWSISSGLKDESDKLVQKMLALDPEYPGLSKLKAKLEKCEPLKDEKKLEELKKAHAKKIDAANDANAKRLFELATKCMKFGLFTRAYDLINAVVEADPDHKQARDVLGYAWESAKKQWITKWEIEKQKKFFLSKEGEGWVEKAHEKDWKEGKREFQGKWIPKEKEEEYRKRNNYNPYTVESEHFEVQTNLGRAKAFDYATRLENFYRQFFRVYIGFYDQIQGAKLLFNIEKMKNKHRVFLFPSQVEYLDYVRSEMSNEKVIKGRAGFYSPAHRRSFFYWTDDKSTLSTLYHEVTHQLFDETKEGRGNSKGNNWVVEGIATYMETWEEVDGKWSPGKKVDIEILLEAKAYLSQHPTWSLFDFVKLEYKEFQETPDSRLHYGLGCGLCHFFLHYGDEVYKERFIQFLSAYYGGKVEEASLATYMKVDFATLEKQFKEYMSRLGSPDQGAAAATTGPGQG
jgi:hypothetical protein